MSSKAPRPRFQLYYWPVPFRGCFVSYLFAYRDVPLLEETGYERIEDLRSRDPGEQSIPFVGPPLLRDLEADRALSQMPAIVLYVSRELELLPDVRVILVLGGIGYAAACRELGVRPRPKFGIAFARVSPRS